MKIIIVGGTGLIGGAVEQELGLRHEIILAGNQKGDIQVDITSTQSIKAMYQKVGRFDAVICTAGKVVFADLAQMTEEKYLTGIHNKLMGQVNLVLLGRDYINEAGSFTLTSGILNHDPIRAGSSAAMVNAALEGFVISAAIELDRGLRINLVSPTVITEALSHYGEYFKGFESVSVATAARAYSKSVEGLQTGMIYRVGY